MRWTENGNQVSTNDSYTFTVTGNRTLVAQFQTSTTVPTVTTAQITNIQQTTAIGGGNVTNSGGSTVSERGICWSISHNPTTSGNHASSGTGTGSFTVSMTDLTANTIYYVRAYATNSVGTAYGNEVSFTTQGEEPDPDDWVDLGLPSGLLWATRNVGATGPEDYGDYFAWGETSSKSVYDWDTYIYGYETDFYPYCRFTKYNTNDNLTTLLPGDDAATANYGGRMPTKEEWIELIDNCTSVWTTLNGVNGRLLTGPNGTTLFLPAAGSRWGSELYGAGVSGHYWSSSLGAFGPDDARFFFFNSYDAYMSSGRRVDGQSVRAVLSTRQN